MAGKRRTFGSAVKKILLVLNILAALALVAAYAALYIDPRNYWPLAFFGLSYPVILVLNVVFLILWTLFWKKYALISLVVILAGFNQLLTLFPIRISSTENPPSGAFRIASYNIHGFRYPGKERTVTQANILRFLAGLKPAVVCLQEFTPRGAETVTSLGNRLGLRNSSFENYFPNNHRGGVNGLVIYTSFPVSGGEFIADSKGRVFAISVDMAVGKDTIRFFNVHLASIRFGSGEYAFYDNLKNQETDKINLGDGLVKILRKLKRAFLDRSEQVDRLSAAVNRSPYLVIVAGDFNDTPFSYSYHRMTRNLEDAYREAGLGLFGNTYAGQLPSYRIDYILYDSRYRAYSYDKFPVTYSDHYPVSTLLAPERNKK